MLESGELGIRPFRGRFFYRRRSTVCCRPSMRLVVRARALRPSRRPSLPSSNALSSSSRHILCSFSSPEPLRASTASPSPLHAGAGVALALKGSLDELDRPRSRSPLAYNRRTISSAEELPRLRQRGHLERPQLQLAYHTPRQGKTGSTVVFIVNGERLPCLSRERLRRENVRLLELATRRSKDNGSFQDEVRI